MAPRTLPRKRNRMIETRIMPAVRLCSTVSTVYFTRSERSRKGTTFTPLGRMPLLSLFDFGVNALQNRVGVVALLQQHDAFDGVGIVDDRAVGPVGGFADLAQANLGALRNGGDVLDLDGRAVLRS